jgi:type I restriction enzyme S subunit
MDLVPLSAVCVVVMGQAPPGSSYNTAGNGYPLIAGAGDFSGGRPQVQKFTVAPTSLSEPGDIVLSIRASIGARVWADARYCLGRGVAGLRAGPRLHPAYLWHWLGSVAVALASRGRGATFLQVNKRDIETLLIPLPSLQEQRRIAAILDQADELRAKRRRTLALIDEALPAAFADLFHGTTNASARLIDVGVIRTGKTPAAGSINTRSLGTPFITPGDLTSGRPATRYVHDIEAISKVAVPAGSLLVCCIGATVGKMALATEVSVYNQQINSVEWGPSVEPAYGLLAVKELQGRIRSAAASTTMPILNKTQFSALKIPVPRLADQQAFGKIFQEHVRSRERAVKHLAYLDELFAALQYRAFTGQL